MNKVCWIDLNPDLADPVSSVTRFRSVPWSPAGSRCPSDFKRRLIKVLQENRTSWTSGWGSSCVFEEQPEQAIYWKSLLITAEKLLIFYFIRDKTSSSSSSSSVHLVEEEPLNVWKCKTQWSHTDMFGTSFPVWTRPRGNQELQRCEGGSSSVMLVLHRGGDRTSEQNQNQNQQDFLRTSEQPWGDSEN